MVAMLHTTHAGGGWGPYWKSRRFVRFKINFQSLAGLLLNAKPALQCQVVAQAWAEDPTHLKPQHVYSCFEFSDVHWKCRLPIFDSWPITPKKCALEHRSLAILRAAPCVCLAA